MLPILLIIRHKNMQKLTKIILLNLVNYDHHHNINNENTERVRTDTFISEYFIDTKTEFYLRCKFRIPRINPSGSFSFFLITPGGHINPLPSRYNNTLEIAY